MLAAASLALAACTTTNTYFTPLRAAPHPLLPRSPESVEIFAAAPPTRPHVDLALIEAAEDGGVGGGSGRLIAKLRLQAATLGCDALVLGTPSSRIDTLTASLTGVIVDRNALSATCIVYASEAELSLAAQPPTTGPLSAAAAAVSATPADASSPETRPSPFLAQGARGAPALSLADLNRR